MKNLVANGLPEQFMKTGFNIRTITTQCKVMCKQKSAKGWQVCKLALGFNMLVLAVLLLLFEPTPKSDDYDMVMILYGGYTGEYSPYALYCNILFGKVIECLMHLCPAVSWYYALQYLGLLLAFSTATYVYIRKSGNQKYLFPCLLFLLFCGYESYIRITFTKTSGILIASGFLFLLYQIEKRQLFCWKYLWGIGLIVCGNLVRGGMYQLTAVIFASSFIFFLLEHRQTEWKELRRWSIYFIVITVGLWMAGKALSEINKWQFNQDEEWRVYSNVNAKRVALNDYGWPEYEKHQQEYRELGISANDIMLWKQYGNINDTDVLTPELMDDIRAKIPINDGKTPLQKLDAASKGLLAYYFNDTGIYLFLLCSIYLGLSHGKKGFLKIGLISGVCLFAYYYMHYQGRLQHHVDVSVLMTGAMLLLYYIFPLPENAKIQKHLYTTAFSIVMVFVWRFYAGLSISSYYGGGFGTVASQREQFAENRAQLTLLSEDMEHMYLFGAYDTNWIYDAAWPMEDVVSPGFYHNLYMANRYEIPDTNQVLKNYDVKNVYKEITDSNAIYFAETGRAHGQIETLCQYIREHYRPNADYTLVKKLDGLYIYRFTEGNIKPKWKDGEIKAGREVQADINVEFEDGICRVSGYAFVEGLDSYAQNIYLCASERDTGKEIYAYTLQSENEQFAEQDKYHGRYSAFSGEIMLEESTEVDEVYLYLDTGEDVYRVKAT